MYFKFFLDTESEHISWQRFQMHPHARLPTNAMQRGILFDAEMSEGGTAALTPSGVIIKETSFSLIQNHL